MRQPRQIRQRERDPVRRRPGSWSGLVRRAPTRTSPATSRRTPSRRRRARSTRSTRTSSTWRRAATPRGQCCVSGRADGDGQPVVLLGVSDPEPVGANPSRGNLRRVGGADRVPDARRSDTSPGREAMPGRAFRGRPTATPRRVEPGRTRHDACRCRSTRVLGYLIGRPCSSRSRRTASCASPTVPVIASRPAPTQSGNDHSSARTHAHQPAPMAAARTANARTMPTGSRVPDPVDPMASTRMSILCRSPFAAVEPVSSFSRIRWSCSTKSRRPRRLLRTDDTIVVVNPMTATLA